MSRLLDIKTLYVALGWGTNYRGDTIWIYENTTRKYCVRRGAKEGNWAL